MIEAKDDEEAEEFKDLMSGAYFEPAGEEGEREVDEIPHFDPLEDPGFTRDELLAMSGAQRDEEEEADPQ